MVRGKLPPRHNLREGYRWSLKLQPPQPDILNFSDFIQLGPSSKWGHKCRKERSNIERAYFGLTSQNKPPFNVLAVSFQMATLGFMSW